MAASPAVAAAAAGRPVLRARGLGRTYGSGEAAVRALREVGTWTSWPASSWSCWAPAAASPPC